MTPAAAIVSLSAPRQVGRRLPSEAARLLAGEQRLAGHMSRVHLAARRLAKLGKVTSLGTAGHQRRRWPHRIGGGDPRDPSLLLAALYAVAGYFHLTQPARSAHCAGLVPLPEAVVAVDRDRRALAPRPRSTVVESVCAGGWNRPARYALWCGRPTSTTSRWTWRRPIRAGGWLSVPRMLAQPWSLARFVTGGVTKWPLRRRLTIVVLAGTP